MSSTAIVGGVPGIRGIRGLGLGRRRTSGAATAAERVTGRPTTWREGHGATWRAKSPGLVGPWSSLRVRRQMASRSRGTPAAISEGAATPPGTRGAGAQAGPTGAERPQPGQAGIGQGHDTHGVAAGGVLGLGAVLAGAHGGGLEAAQADVAVGGAQHVVGLEVEVVHAALAGGLQGRRDLTGDAAHLVTGHARRR